ncbi:MAG: MAPEG family protein [Methylobacteriaceae bacterium]|nr:MAPEG family protein [Methylobacteriaceae bacterium]MBV9245076.1 MAPEG family protein [Methylobacteriaceae bacterium]MBV9634183.1 MAPEG family protein [Methylobacteriaceae bacterium]MBV9702156.1 MAPEG family protein [Methylobacteriaceae bacterium]
MTIALWCVLIAAILPLVLVGISRAGQRYDNRDPRGASQALEGSRKRAHSAHLNAFEAFPFFAAAVIVAEMKGAPRGALDGLAVAFIIVRIVHAGAYLGDQAPLRSAIWTVGFLLTIGIFILPLWR